MSAIPYHELQRARREIRLIVLEDAPKLAKLRSATPPPLKCTIIHSSLDDFTSQTTPSSMWQGLRQRPHLKYFALSYVWGDPDPTCELGINGVQAKITKSLSDALHSIRDHTDFRVIWADAVCINQNDNIEKSWQVQQMTSTYKYADRVIAWLGPASPDSDLAMATLQSVHRQIRKMSFSKARRYEVPSVWAHRQMQQSLDKFFSKRIKEFAAIAELWIRPYWTRIWIIQEIAVSRKTIFLCGSSQAEDVEVALLAISEFASLKVYKKTDESKAMTMGDIYLINRQPEFLVVTKMAEQLEHHNLYQLLFYAHGGSHDYQAFNPRDYVYGLLGLATDQQSLGIVADYDKSPQLIYKDVVRRVVKSGYTDILALAVSEKNIPDLPSWVPDFSNLGHVFFCTYNTAQIEKAEDPLVPYFPVTEETDGLAIRGSTVGIITKLAPEPDFNEGDGSLASLLQWLVAIEMELLLNLVEEREHFWINPLPIVLGTPRSVQDRGRLARSLFANMDPSTGITISDPRHAEMYYLIVRSFTNNPAGLESRLNNAERLGDADAIATGMYLSGVMQHALKGCRVYRLDTGHIGLASPGCQVGDKVVEFPGGSFPFVIRKNENDVAYLPKPENIDDSSIPNFAIQTSKLVGMAFLDWMRYWKLSGKVTEEPFILR